MTDEWRARVAAVWADADRLGDDQVVARIDELAAERDEGDALALFETAGARDSAGREAEAEPLYLAALEAGLPEPERSQAVIQLASTIRNLGRPEESLELLRAEFADKPDHELADAATAFAALALHELGQTTEALSATLTALAPHLPAYRRSVTAYAAALLDD
jgi:tetratricopeptide (TPR) repeat protein